MFKFMTMKRLHLLLFFIGFSLSGFAQKVFSVDYESQADVKIFVVDYESQADLLVFKVDYESQATGNEGLWSFVKYASQASKKIYFVDYESQADVKVFFVQYQSQAGWKNKEKQHFFY
jgi:hypothetical protein